MIATARLVLPGSAHGVVTLGFRRLVQGISALLAHHR
jgi:hypothetical protein